MTCQNTALEYDSVPPIDNSFIRSQEETIPANIPLPTYVWLICTNMYTFVLESFAGGFESQREISYP